MHCEINIRSFFLGLYDVYKLNIFSEKVFIDCVGQWLKNIVA